MSSITDFVRPGSRERRPEPPAAPAPHASIEREMADVVAARSEHVRAATAVEADGDRVREHGAGMLAITKKKLAEARAGNEAALAEAGRACDEKAAEVSRAAEEYDAACAAYNALCEKHADEMLAAGDALVGMIAKHKERVRAKTTAILAAGEPEPPAAAEGGGEQTGS